MIEVFNRTVRGLRAKTEVWCHTCWGNPSQQRMFAQVQSYKPALEVLRRLLPGREVVPIPSRTLVRGLGAVHCLTQQQPAM